MDIAAIQKHIGNINIARYNILFMFGITVLNVFLEIFNTGYYFLFSAIMPLLFIYLYPVISIAVIVVFFLCGFLSGRGGKLRGLLLVALILFVIDWFALFFLISLYGFNGSDWLDIAFHIWITIYLVVGVVSWAKLRGVSVDDVEVVDMELADAEQADSEPDPPEETEQNE